jgi:SAM-dependent methyltransferase
VQQTRPIDFADVAHTAWNTHRDINGYHAAMAAFHKQPAGSDVLVVGCNRGEDCKRFVDWGAKVIGLDIMDEIGINFSHPHASYAKASVEAMPFADGRFDLVYAIATLEHVHDIFAAFKEMARACRRGGIIYSAAAPLWNCRSGPHWGSIFDREPWPHLRMTTEEIIELCKAMGESTFLPDQIRYFMNPEFFNRRPARDYLAATWSVPFIDVIQNDIQIEDRPNENRAIERYLTELGFSRMELFGLTHLFVARKL